MLTGCLGFCLPSHTLCSDWNPQMDLQAMDRAHRIGQKKEVQVSVHAWRRLALMQQHISGNTCRHWGQHTMHVGPTHIPTRNIHGGVNVVLGPSMWMLGALCICAVNGVLALPRCTPRRPGICFVHLTWSNYSTTACSCSFGCILRLFS